MHVLRPLLSLAVVLALSTPAGAGTILALGGCSSDQCPPPPNTGFVAVATGNYHGMGLRADGSIVTWGLCDMEQCNVPAPNSGYTAIAAGDSFSLALRDGSIVAWGSNEQGQLAGPEPNSGFVAIAAGMLHGLALRADGSIAAWGWNATGGATPPEPNTGFVAVAGSGWGSMALRADGSVVKWGCLGGDPCPLPSPNTGFVAISGHFEHSLALRSDGSIAAWGSNAHGQLDVPAPNSGFTAIAAGSTFSLGLRSSGVMEAWGGAGVGAVPLPNSGYLAMSANSGVANFLRTTTCTTDAECDDGTWCTGDESCEGGTCVSGPPRCAAPDHCRESDQQCVPCLMSAHCDDGLFCNGLETCGPDGTCVPGANPCIGLACDENANACVGGDLWLSFTGATSVPGLGTVADEDVVSRDPATGAWSIVFDGSDVGLASLAIDGMARRWDGALLLSFTEPGNVPGLTGGPAGTAVDDSDVVTFTPASLGPVTAGTFSFYFDGSDVGLTTDNEDVDAVALMPNGRLVISTLGNASVPGANGQDADLLMFIESHFGASTSGTFSLHFDGSDVALTTDAEDVDAADVRLDGSLLLSTLGSFAVPGLAGADEDVVKFTPTSLGDATAGTYSMHLDLTNAGIAGSANVAAVDLIEPQ